MYLDMVLECSELRGREEWVLLLLDLLGRITLLDWVFLGMGLGQEFLVRGLSSEDLG